MARVEDWVERLDEVFSAADQPFVWGTHDCCQFTAACVEAMTGKRPFSETLGTYDTKRAAYLLIGKMGGIRKLLNDTLGEPIERAFAGRGSVALIGDEATGFSLGVVDLSGEWIFCLDEHGTRRVPLNIAVDFWKV